MRAFSAALLSMLFIASPAFAADDTGFRFGTNPEIRQVRPEKPVRIKLKRKEDGTYTWELSGGNAEEVIKVDRQLRQYLKVK
jgi:hypothetical protein